MTNVIILCFLLLVAYVFDLTSAKTRIPTVIFLLLMGWVVRNVVMMFQMNVADFSQILPVVGTIGLILIVLEGSLELKLERSKLPLIKSSVLGAIIPMFVLSFLLAFFFSYYTGAGLRTCLVNAIPFCVISSAIAIPSVHDSSEITREFVIYESSFSDIIGILFFNFLLYNDVIDGFAFAEFGGELMIMLLVSLIATFTLAFLISKIEHHVKFVPVILLVILIYAIAKQYHLPALIFILMFGLTVSNIELFSNYKLVQKVKPKYLRLEITKLNKLIAEGAFLIRSLFFLVFGFLIETQQLLNSETFTWALIIVLFIVAIRFIQLKISRLPLVPLLFILPRGLITILLFLSIAPESQISMVNKSLVIQVVILSALIMMTGLIFDPKGARDEIVG
jgi:potassium/hydrogen antiporter